MDVRERINNLVSEVRPLPGGDAEATFRRGRRRVRRRRILAAGGSAVVVAVAVVWVALPDAGSRLPLIGDTPESVDVEIPDGWQTITAGEIAVSIPPDWDVSRPYDAFKPPEGASLGGPCHTDLYQPREADGDEDSGVPVAVVYDRPTDGVCRLIGFSGPPPRPGLVLFETIRGTVDGLERQPGGERVDIEDHARRDQIGQLEVWRTEDDDQANDVDGSGIVAYIAAELTGGIWVSHPNDTIVERILATARPAPGAQPRTIAPVTAHRDLPDDAWELLGEGASDHYLGGGEIVTDQAELDHLWAEFDFEGQAPALPERTIALAGATNAGGLPGGCHEHREVVGVRMRGSGANILLGPFAPGQQGQCSDRPIIHIVTAPPELAKSLAVVATETVENQ